MNENAARTEETSSMDKYSSFFEAILDPYEAENNNPFVSWIVSFSTLHSRRCFSWTWQRWHGIKVLLHISWISRYLVSGKSRMYEPKAKWTRARKPSALRQTILYSAWLIRVSDFSGRFDINVTRRYLLQFEIAFGWTVMPICFQSHLFCDKIQKKAADMPLLCIPAWCVVLLTLL